MSHSYKHTKIFGSVGCRSAKGYKKWNHHRERARVKQALIHGRYDEADIELSPWNAWEDPRDGKGYRENFYPQSGFGIHQVLKWGSWKSFKKFASQEYWDDLFEKAMRK